MLFCYCCCHLYACHRFYDLKNEKALLQSGGCVSLMPLTTKNWRSEEILMHKPQWELKIVFVGPMKIMWCLATSCTCVGRFQFIAFISLIRADASFSLFIWWWLLLLLLLLFDFFLFVSFDFVLFCIFSNFKTNEMRLIPIVEPKMSLYLCHSSINLIKESKWFVNEAQ